MRKVCWKDSLCIGISNSFSLIEAVSEFALDFILLEVDRQDLGLLDS